MAKAVTDTSPLLYLYRIGKVDILPQVFEEVLTVPAVVSELAEGQAKGYEVPKPEEYNWLRVVSPQKMPSEWLASDLGKGELETMALALASRESCDSGRCISTTDSPSGGFGSLGNVAGAIGSEKTRVVVINVLGR